MICIVARGQVVINVEGHVVHLTDILYVPDANTNLISVWALANNGIHVTFESDKAHLEWPDSYNHPKRCIFSHNFIHEWCGHPGRDKTRMIEKLYKLKIKPDDCQVCAAGKSMKAQMGQSSRECAKSLMELIHVDLAMHFSMMMEFTCLLVAIDDASSFTYVKPLQAKSDALQVLREWI
ncbi:hypothetical protein NDA17_001662 [Ustilago hordei]|nr:hypothetical protein NDA17_001662 [Ustilago hordei]